MDSHWAEHIVRIDHDVALLESTGGHGATDRRRLKGVLEALWATPARHALVPLFTHSCVQFFPSVDAIASGTWIAFLCSIDGVFSLKVIDGLGERHEYTGSSVDRDAFVQRIADAALARQALGYAVPMEEPRPPLPPFDADSAALKVRRAEDAWNTRDPEKVALAYTPDSVWRNRAEFLTGRAEIVAFLTRKWARELEYRLIKELWTFGGDRIAVRFAYEWRDDSGHWFRSYGNENWEFNEHGFMQRRVASINDLPIAESDRKYHWPLGRRPDDHPSLSELGL